MPPFKSLLIRLLIFCASYAALFGVLGIPAIQHGVADLFSGVAKPLMGLLLPKAYLHVERERKEDLEALHLVRVLFGNQQQVAEQMEGARKAGQQKASLSLQEFKIKMDDFLVMPLVFFLSLLVITPVPWQRKVAGALWGSLLIGLFSWVKLLFYTLYNFAQFPTGVYEITGLGYQMAAFVHDYVKMGANILFATLVWALVAFRQSDWQKVLNAISGQPAN